MTTVYYSTKRGQPAIPAKIEAHVWPTERNPRAYIRIIGQGQPSTLLTGDPAQMVATLQILIETIIENSCREVREEITGLLTADNQAERFSTLQMSDLAEQMPVAQKVNLLIEHFTQLGMTDIAAGLIEDYKMFTGKTYKVSANDNQLAQDIQRIKPVLHIVRRRDGSINRSEVARQLGVKPGGAAWQRVVDVCQALDSSSSPEENGEVDHKKTALGR